MGSTVVLSQQLVQLEELRIDGRRHYHGGEGRMRNHQKQGAWVHYIYPQSEELDKLYAGKSNIIAELKKTGKLIKLAEGSYKDDKETGIWQYYHPNGEIRSKGKIAKGLMEGDWQTFYDNGKIAKTATYVNGLEQGITEMFHSNGTLGMRVNFEKGLEEGSMQKFYEDGSMWTSGSYKAGKRVGTWKGYHENGQLEEIIIYVDGKAHGESIMYHDNGKPKLSGTYKDGRPVGVWKEFNPGGILTASGTFDVERKKDGAWEVYYPDGKLWKKQEYDHGMHVSYKETVYDRKGRKYDPE
ncbi:hypothetical protein GCM10027051_00560 [Niabella terrae]